MRTSLVARQGLAFLCAVGVAASSLAGTLPEDGSIQDFRTIIRSAKAKVFPAVIFLTTIREGYEGGKKEKQQLGGSGVILSEKGEAVTNWHVVDKAVTIRCLLFDGTVGTAELIGKDKDTDLALIQVKVPGRTSYPAADLGDSDALSEGQFVMAMGAPWGLSRSVSFGIISCTTRFLKAHTGGYNLWIQTDASINPGNSGGPLVNTKGVVVGINTMGYLWGGDLAFAIPANVVQRTIAALREHGEVPRAWTGLRLQPLKDFERNIFYDAETGVLVAGVDTASPAAKAGIKIGDLLLAVNSREISGINREDIPAINQLLAKLEMDEPTEIRLRRGGKEMTLELTPRRKGKVEGDDFDCRAWNLTVKTINEFATPALHFFKKKGVYVQGVKRPGNAANAGVRVGDILLTVDDKPVESLGDLKTAYEAVTEDEEREKKVNLVLQRGGLKRYVVLDYATKYHQD